MPSFLHVTSTYRKHASVTSPLDLPFVSAYTFLEGVLTLPDSSQVGGSSGNDSALSSLQAPRPTFKSLMFAFIHAQEDFLFRSPCTLRDLTNATSSLRIDMTSSLSLRQHVD
jgi:hypothetical protein